MKTGELRSNIIVDHAADTPYFEKAESEGWTSVFWADSTVFRRMFDKLDLAVVTELACGQGRHAARIIERAGHITLVDPVPTN
jgi:hypothetical protein